MNNTDNEPTPEPKPGSPEDDSREPFVHGTDDAEVWSRFGAAAMRTISDANPEMSHAEVAENAGIAADAMLVEYRARVLLGRRLRDKALDGAP